MVCRACSTSRLHDSHIQSRRNGVSRAPWAKHSLCSQTVHSRQEARQGGEVIMITLLYMNNILTHVGELVLRFD